MPQEVLWCKWDVKENQWEVSPLGWECGVLQVCGRPKVKKETPSSSLQTQTTAPSHSHARPEKLIMVNIYFK